MFDRLLDIIIGIILIEVVILGVLFISLISMYVIKV